MLLCLFAYPLVKRVVSESCERVISCRVRAFTLFPEIPWRVGHAHGVGVQRRTKKRNAKNGARMQDL